MFSANGVRNAEPLDARQRHGASFRPHQRRSGYGQLPATSRMGRAEREQLRLHSQFRPTEARRKQTYEQLQSGIVSAQRMGAPHWVMAASDMRGYGGHWSGW